MALIENTGIDRDKLLAALTAWPGLARAQCTLINHTENATFRLDLPDGSKKILRVHRPGYNSELAITSELTWAKALRTDMAVQTPIAIAGNNGHLLQSAHVSGANAPQFMVLFEFEEGNEPQENENLSRAFVELGRLAATAHNHVQQWQMPVSFERMRWTASSILDPNGLWGDWRKAPGMTEQFRSTFDRLDALLRQRLAEFGQVQDRYGLIHADMRLANLLVDGRHIKLIDFDDCGFCWYMYDFAAAISFIEDSPEIPALKAAWLRGYRKERTLAEADEAEMDTFVMLRRMALTAWIGSHSETPFAQSLAGDFVRRGAKLAQDYLLRFGAA
ncbi:phosphotransferase [uncultured Maritalea sp.]|uniref:phosphotransferase enzyme family protein n=1 Tax=uncultured Maritalea sp. TaxID=757249 RepID=UPI0026227100|nr:phosphotransferase [uncultured Maritalea sp.]